MKIVCAMLFTLFLASTSFAQDGAQNSNDSVVRWKSIVGVITAQGVNNPVSAHINSGTFAWSVRSGHARVNLANGNVAFNVEGLVINGTSFSGTPGPITSVTVPLVCNAGTDQEATYDTEPVALGKGGDARFSGRLTTRPNACDNPLFLIRIFSPEGAQGRWIATGAQRTFEDFE